MPTVQPVILTTRLEALRDFYAELLGGEEVLRVPAEGTPFYLALRIGDGELGLVAKDDPALADAVPRVVLSIAVDDLAGTGARVEPLGGTVTGGPNDMPWGQRVLHIKDPDGNPVNLTQQTGPRAG